MIGAMDDRRVALVIRALRRRRGWRQSDLAAAAHLSQSAISAIERGHLESFSLNALRRVFSILEIRAEIDARWRGGALDRMIDEGHSRVVGATAVTLEKDAWKTAAEVTYSIYGERGSIDLLAFHPPTGSLLVVEIKTELTSVEEMLRRHDQKVRLGPRIARERSGWHATSTSRLLVLPDTSTNRDQFLRHARVLDSVLPDDNIAVRRWIQNPVGMLNGRWFLRIINPRTVTEGTGGGHRVRRPSGGPVHAQSSSRDTGHGVSGKAETPESRRNLP